MIEDLRPHRAFFRNICGSGGRVSVIVDIFNNSDISEMTLPPDLLHALGDLGIHFVVHFSN